MRAAKGVSRFRFVWLPVGVALAGLIGPPTTARAGNVGVIVPSYFSPGSGGPGGVGDGWAAMAAAASQISVTAILNPNSGPLAGPADPNYVNAMTNLENAGGHVVAYVYTDSGNAHGLAPLSMVESEIQTYLTQYGSLINGFFLDGTFIIPSTLSYYQSLESYIKGLSASYSIIGNPGQPFLNGVSTSDYLSTANVFNIFEGTDASFSSYPYGLNWFQGFPSDRFSNVIYDVPSVSAMLADLDRAVQLNAGSVYITDESGGNPYTQLPSYWDQEVAAIASVPEPGVWTNLVSLALCGSLGLTLRSCQRRRRMRPKGQSDDTRPRGCKLRAHSGRASFAFIRSCRSSPVRASIRLVAELSRRPVTPDGEQSAIWRERQRAGRERRNAADLLIAEGADRRHLHYRCDIPEP